MVVGGAYFLKFVVVSANVIITGGGLKVYCQSERII
jgi:hypothetical protein